MGMTNMTAFLDDMVIARGTREEVADAIAKRHPAVEPGRIRLFDDETGRVADLDLRPEVPEPAPAPRGRGRPRLGVVAREVTLLPRQWEWLSSQPGGASAAIRRLVEAARKAPPSPAARREAAHRFMTETCGDRAGYEEALRSLYRGDEARFEATTAAWPADLRAYALALLGRGPPTAAPSAAVPLRDKPR
jgi:hypothetical protein